MIYPTGVVSTVAALFSKKNITNLILGYGTTVNTLKH
jgi:hypothetical protein